MLSIDLNCDMGESTEIWNYDIEKDLNILQYLSSINIACGYHAGDTDTMKILVEAAIKKNVAIGAHPSFPDRENFGRSNMTLSLDAIYEITCGQIHLLHKITNQIGASLHHVKPHGALYNMAALDPNMSDAICKAIKDINPNLILYGLSGSELIKCGKKAGLKTYNEIFADRTYQEDGTLTPRNKPHAIIEETEKSAAQILQILTQKTVVAVTGKEIPIVGETICIHSDGANALNFAKKINDLLRENNILVNAS